MLAPLGRRTFPSAADAARHPHLACTAERPEVPGVPAKLVRRVRDLPADLPGTGYDEHDPKVCRSTEHQGQRKLALTEIEFLTDCYARLGPERCRELTVVYSGSAPGTHLGVVLRLFHGVFARWDLYDDVSRFDPWLARDPDVRIAPFPSARGMPRGYFGQVVARQYRDVPCIYISDIRTDDTSDERIALENEAMRLWTREMRPVRAMLKFRLPFTAGKSYPVLRGTPVLQAWAPTRSTETRLWVDGAAARSGKTVPMGDTAYETRLNTFNQHYRAHAFRVAGQPAGTCPCYDHVAERLICARYLRLGPPVPGRPEEVDAIVAALERAAVPSVMEDFRQAPGRRGNGGKTRSRPACKSLRSHSLPSGKDSRNTRTGRSSRK